MKRALLSAIAALLLAATLTAADSARRSTTNDILDRYVQATASQQLQLRGLSMDVEIDAKLPKLKKEGRLRAFRKISRLGKITYNALNFVGDKTIKNDVIARYLTAETHVTDGQADDVSITPKNYKFKFKGAIENSGRQMYQFELIPRKKRVGLFKGHIWLDASTCLPLRESGRMVKNPSIFLKKVEFERDYEIRDGVAYPRHIKSLIETRLVGPAELVINYSNFAKEETAQAVASQPSEAQ